MNTFLIEPYNCWDKNPRKKHWTEILEEESLYYRLMETSNNNNISSDASDGSTMAAAGKLQDEWYFTKLFCRPANTKLTWHHTKGGKNLIEGDNLFSNVLVTDFQKVDPTIVKRIYMLDTVNPIYQFGNLSIYTNLIEFYMSGQAVSNIYVPATLSLITSNGSSVDTLTLSGNGLIQAGGSANARLNTLTVSGTTTLSWMTWNNNPMLTTVNLPAITTLVHVEFENCALSETSINNILVALDAGGAVGPGPIALLSGGTNAAPSGVGITAKNSLVAKNWFVQTN